jgi:hypothetical protein
MFDGLSFFTPVLRRFTFIDPQRQCAPPQLIALSLVHGLIAESSIPEVFPIRFQLCLSRHFQIVLTRI